MKSAPPGRWLPLLAAPGVIFLLGSAAAVITALDIPTFIKQNGPGPGIPATRLRAATALPISQEPLQVDATDVVYTTFTGEAGNVVDTVLTSPAATAIIDQTTKHQIFRGNSTVLLKRPDLEASGEQWSYEYISKTDCTIVINKNARVVYYGLFK